MPLPRASLRSFLSSAKSTLNRSFQQSSPVTFVVGNEAADLDSLCCTVVLAYLRTYAPTSRSNTLYIPLSNLPRADLALHPELTLALSNANLEPSDLITLSDLPPLSHISSQLPPERTRWLLVDHNALQGELGRVYGTRLVGCIDHHDEEGKVPLECEGEPRIVRKIGSCSSLVVEYCREAWDALSKESTDGRTASWDRELARLALAPILVDTANLADVHKVTGTDIKVASYLESLIMADPDSTFDSVQYYEKLTAAKNDTRGLSLADILRQDYKQWTEDHTTKIGISSVTGDMQALVDKAGDKEELLTTIEDFAKERDLSICSIMTTSQKDGSFQRELLVWALDEPGVQAMVKFESESKEKLGLQRWGDGSLDLDDGRQWRHFWCQGRVEHSRKQVAPMLRTAMQRL